MAKREKILGGAATHFALAASYFTDVRVIGVVGNRLRSRGRGRLHGAAASTSRASSTPTASASTGPAEYSGAMNEAKTLGTDLNVFATSSPKFRPPYQDSDYLFLANIDPVLQLRVRHANART